MPRDYFFELSSKQVKRGHEVNVITWNKSKHACTILSENGFVIHRLSGLNLGLSGFTDNYPYLPDLPARLELLNPDIVHCESHLFLPSVQSLLKAEQMHIPSIITVHGVFADRGFMSNSIQKTYIRLLCKTFRKARFIICLTHNDALEISQLGCSSEKIRLVPNAVDTELFQPLDNKDSDLIVWHGRFVPEKGLEYLISAMKLVLIKKKNAKLLIIGYGPMKAKLVNLALDLNLLNTAVFFSQVMSREEISKILAKATIYVLPSIKEGLPLSVLEAMACGLPIIGCNVSGVNELVFDKFNGILVPPRTPEAIADSIIFLLNDPEARKRLGDNARKTAVEKYAWAKTLDQLDSIYHEAESVNSA